VAGMIAGLVARRVLGLFDATCAAVWIHGKAAELAGEGMISEDLSGQIPSVFSLIIDPPEIEDVE